MIKIQKFVIKHNKDICKLFRTALRILIALVVTQYSQSNLLIIVFGKIKNVNRQQHKIKLFYMIKFNNGTTYMITFARILKNYVNLILLMLRL